MAINPNRDEIIIAEQLHQSFTFQKENGVERPIVPRNLLDQIGPVVGATAYEELGRLGLSVVHEDGGAYFERATEEVGA